MRLWRGGVSSAEAATRYVELGYTVVPVPPGEKNPGRRGWERLRISLEEVPNYFTNGQNVGIHCGEPSGWLVPADLDAPEAVKLGGRFLPPTLTSGRESVPDAHWWYYAEGAEHRTFTDLDGSMILELRSTGHHTLVAPSIHPSGDRYRWSKSGLEIERVGASSLLFDCRQLATAALIARHMPQARDRSGAGGGRHNLALALAGFMLRRDLAEETVLKVLKGAWEAKGFGGDGRAKDAALRDLEGIIQDTAARLRDGEPATGGKRLEELVPGLRKKIADYWDWAGRMDDETTGEASANGRDTKLPAADRLVNYVRAAQWPLFVDQHSESHTLAEGQAVPISRTNRLLTKLLYKHEEKAPSNDGLIGARRVLDMLAHDSGDVRELHTRAAFHEGVVFYQLSPGRVVRIDENGWTLAPGPSVYFRAVKNLQPLPSPTPGGKLEEVAEWVNLKTDRDRRLFLTYVTLVALAHIPRPILQATGVMGSGKSTAGRVVKRLWDPTGNETVTVDRRDFLQKAAHCYILMLDNQNSLPEWFQDTLCRLVTGESDSKRVLYSDDDDLVWSMKRAVLLNGINPPSERGDVQDRTLPIELDRLDKRKRLPEDDFWLQFSLAHPRLLGAVFDALAGALRARHTVVLAERPRLADWGLYAAALYESQGWGVETFVEDWRGVEETQQQGTLDGSIVAQAVILFMEDKDRVELSAAKLHTAIEDRVEDDLDLAHDKTWPKTGRTLWKKIREITPLLEVHGIRAYRSTSTRAGRPIILDTDFEGGGDDYTKNGNDKQSVGTINSDLSAPNTPDTYAAGTNKAPGNDILGFLSPSHTLIKQEGMGHGGRKSAQGESRPDLSVPSFHRSAGDEKATVEEAQTNSTNSETHKPPDEESEARRKSGRESW